MFLLLSFSLSVDKSKYYTCNELDYCRKSRFTKAQNLELSKDFEFDGNNNFSTSILKNEKQIAELIVSRLKNGMTRFRIQPKNVSDLYDSSKEELIIHQTVLNNKTTIEKEDGNNVTYVLSTEKQKIILNISPFKITIIQDEKAVLEINSDDDALLGTEENEKNVAMSFKFLSENTKISGFPSHTLPINIQDTKHGDEAITDPIRLFNTDINSYEVNSTMSMYGSIPYVLGHSGKQSTSIFWLNPSETWLDKEGNSIRIMSETDYIDFFVTCGTHKEVIESYTELTGKPCLLPLWAFGYHQCRWGYMDTNTVLDVSKQMDEDGIPHDVLWLDLDHTDDRKYFTFGKGFHSIGKFQKRLFKKGRKVVALIDPHLAAKDDYYVYKEAMDNDFLIQNNDGSDLRMNCWPGRSAWVDYMNPAAREWWSTLFNYSKYKKSSKILFAWNDMNEPAVFDVKDATLPRDALHYEGHLEREVHNLYGHMMISATYDGFLKRSNYQERPFILTRSFFAGSQRYAATWTGDNAATWEMLANSLQMIITYGICGMPYAGADVGGFFNSPDPELLTRWYQVGAWCYPFFRCHCHHLSDRREPHTLPKENLACVRSAIRERYALLPLWYTLAHEAHVTGQPIVRPLWWEFDSDSEDMIMIGNSILVAPLLKKGRKDMDIKLPDGIWYSYRKLRPAKGEMSLKGVDQNVPAFIRGGSIFAIKPKERISSKYMRNDHYAIIVALDEEMKAEGELYIDDENSLKYEIGEYIDIHFKFENDTLTSTIEGDFPSAINRINEIKIAGIQKQPSEVTFGTRIIKFEYSRGILLLKDVDLYVSDPLSIKINYEQPNEAMSNDL